MVKKTILLIDDHKEFREMLRLFIEKQFKEVEIKESATGEEGVEVAVKERPQVALIDICLPQMDGLQAARQIKQQVPGCHIITMSMLIDRNYQKFVAREMAAFIEKDEINEGLIPLLNRFLNK